MYETHAKSTGAKVLLLGLNALGVALGAVILSNVGADPARALLVVACSLVYWLRIIATTFAFANREVRYAEAIGVGTWIVVIHVTMALLGAFNSDPPGVLTLAGVLLYLIGSVVNTGSEWLRMRWKADPANAGQLYTGGFFRFAVHINYFGDVVLFTGFALVVGSLWALVIPALMATLFVTVNIPMLDKHLREHYGQPFSDYAARTAKFLPFIY